MKTLNQAGAEEWDAVRGRSALKRQVNGTHYKDFPIQPVEFIERNGLSYCVGNAVKYLCRYRDKGGIQDLDKAIHYIEILKELEHEQAR